MFDFHDPYEFLSKKQTRKTESRSSQHLDSVDIMKNNFDKYKNFYYNKDNAKNIVHSSPHQAEATPSQKDDGLKSQINKFFGENHYKPFLNEKHSLRPESLISPTFQTRPRGEHYGENIQSKKSYVSPKAAPRNNFENNTLNFFGSNQLINQQNTNAKPQPQDLALPVVSKTEINSLRSSANMNLIQNKEISKLDHQRKMETSPKFGPSFGIGAPSKVEGNRIPNAINYDVAINTYLAFNPLTQQYEIHKKQNKLPGIFDSPTQKINFYPPNVLENTIRERQIRKREIAEKISQQKIDPNISTKLPSAGFSLRFLN